MERRTNPGLSTAVAALASLLLLGACGGEGGEAPEAEPATTPATAPTTTEAEPGAETGEEAGSHGEGDEQSAVAEGRMLFRETGCGECHTLADAGTTGTVGPDLDEHFGAEGHAHGRRAIVRQIRMGGGGMPAFGDRLTRREMRTLADYLLAVAGE